MRLYHSPASPFVRMVMVALHETGLMGQVEVVTVAGTLYQPGTYPLAQNPLGKIPTLERDDGPALHDSRVILRYIDQMAGGTLYPAPPRLWETLTLEATAQGICEAALLMVLEARYRPEERRSAEWVEAQWGKAARALDALEGRWISHLAGQFDAGQIATGCALGYLDLRHPGRDWRAGRPALAAWAARFAERPAMVATRPQA
jgi:glutathione S-transferase